MAAPKQSARQQTNMMIIIGLLIVLIIGVGVLFLSPNSPLRPKASELPTQTATGSSQQVESREGQISNIDGDKVAVDEANGGSFSFTMTDATLVRGLKNNIFEIVDRTQLGRGDFVSVFYQNTDTAQRVSRVDIIKKK